MTAGSGSRINGKEYGMIKYDDPLQCAPCAGEKFIKPLSVVLEKWIRCGRDSRPTGSSSGRRQEMIQFQSQAVPNISIYDYLRRLAENFQCSSECFVLALIYMDRVIKTNPSCVINEYNIHRLLVTAVMLAVKFFDDLYYTNQYYAHIGGVETAEINELEENFLHLVYWRLMVTPEEYEEYLDDVYSTPWTESQMINQPRSIRNGPAVQGSAPPARERAETGEHAGRGRVDQGSVVGAHAAQEIRRPQQNTGNNMAHATTSTSAAVVNNSTGHNSTGRSEKYVPPGARGSNNNRWRAQTSTNTSAEGVITAARPFGSQASMQTRRFPTQQQSQPQPQPTSSSVNGTYGAPATTAGSAGGNEYRQYPYGHDASSKRHGGGAGGGQQAAAGGGQTKPKWRAAETNNNGQGSTSYNNNCGSNFSQRKSQYSNNTTNSSRFHKKKSNHSATQHMRYTPVGMSGTVGGSLPFQQKSVVKHESENVTFGPSFTNGTGTLLSSIRDDSTTYNPPSCVNGTYENSYYDYVKHDDGSNIINNNIGFTHTDSRSTIETLDSPVCTIKELNSMMTIITTQTWTPEGSLDDSSKNMSHQTRIKQCHSNLSVPPETVDEKAARIECAAGNLKRFYSASTICSDGNSHYSTTSSDHNEAEETVANLSS